MGLVLTLSVDRKSQNQTPRTDRKSQLELAERDKMAAVLKCPSCGDKRTFRLISNPPKYCAQCHMPYLSKDKRSHKRQFVATQEDEQLPSTSARHWQGDLLADSNATQTFDEVQQLCDAPGQSLPVQRLDDSGEGPHGADLLPSESEQFGARSGPPPGEAEEPRRINENMLEEARLANERSTPLGSAGGRTYYKDFEIEDDEVRLSIRERLDALSQLTQKNINTTLQLLESFRDSESARDELMFVSDYLGAGNGRGMQRSTTNHMLKVQRLLLGPHLNEENNRLGHVLSRFPNYNSMRDYGAELAAALYGQLPKKVVYTCDGEIEASPDEMLPDQPQHAMFVHTPLLQMLLRIIRGYPCHEKYRPCWRVPANLGKPFSKEHYYLKPGTDEQSVRYVVVETDPTGPTGVLHASAKVVRVDFGSSLLFHDACDYLRYGLSLDENLVGVDGIPHVPILLSAGWDGANMDNYGKNLKPCTVLPLNLMRHSDMLLVAKIFPPGAFLPEMFPKENPDKLAPWSITSSCFVDLFRDLKDTRYEGIKAYNSDGELRWYHFFLGSLPTDCPEHHLDLCLFKNVNVNEPCQYCHITSEQAIAGEMSTLYCERTESEAIDLLERHASTTAGCKILAKMSMKPIRSGLFDWVGPNAPSSMGAFKAAIVPTMHFLEEGAALKILKGILAFESTTAFLNRLESCCQFIRRNCPLTPFRHASTFYKAGKTGESAYGLRQNMTAAEIRSHLYIAPFVYMGTAHHTLICALVDFFMAVMQKGTHFGTTETDIAVIRRKAQYLHDIVHAPPYLLADVPSDFCLNLFGGIKWHTVMMHLIDDLMRLPHQGKHREEMTEESHKIKNNAFQGSQKQLETFELQVFLKECTCCAIKYVNEFSAASSLPPPASFDTAHKLSAATKSAVLDGQKIWKQCLKVSFSFHACAFDTLTEQTKFRISVLFPSTPVEEARLILSTLLKLPILMDKFPDVRVVNGGSLVSSPRTYAPGEYSVQRFLCRLKWKKAGKKGARRDFVLFNKKISVPNGRGGNTVRTQSKFAQLQLLFFATNQSTGIEQEMALIRCLRLTTAADTPPTPDEKRLQHLGCLRLSWETSVFDVILVTQLKQVIQVIPSSAWDNHAHETPTNAGHTQLYHWYNALQVANIQQVIDDIVRKNF